MMLGPGDLIMTLHKQLTVPFNRSFGLEFEFTRPSCTIASLEEAIRFALPDLPFDELRIADWEHTPHDNPEWVVKRDGSCGWEICTPRCDGRPALDRVCKVLEACRKVGAKVGPRTGVHIHYGCEDFTETQLGRLVAYWIKMEGMIFSSLPRKRRGNPFCMTLSRAGDIKTENRYSEGDLIHIAGQNRYRALNIRPWLEGFRRVETRVIEGTMDPETIRQWIYFFFQFVDRAQRSRMPKNLRWFGVDEALEWMGWYGKEEARVSYIPDPEMAYLRNWWLRRIMKYSSVRVKTSLHRERARQFLCHFTEGN